MRHPLFKFLIHERFMSWKVSKGLIHPARHHDITMATDPAIAQATPVAQQFMQHYYNLFDTQRDQMASLYVRRTAAFEA